jgi:hypothetical protein
MSTFEVQAGALEEVVASVQVPVAAVHLSLRRDRIGILSYSLTPDDAWA